MKYDSPMLYRTVLQMSTPSKIPAPMFVANMGCRSCFRSVQDKIGNMLFSLISYQFSRRTHLGIFQDLSTFRRAVIMSAAPIASTAWYHENGVSNENLS